jgi:multicomponent K+:H+ antiporter subunit G
VNSTVIELLLSLLILVGASFTLIGSLGLVRLKDFYSRLHAPTKATTLGVGSLLIASAVFFSHQEPGLSLHEMLVTLFLFITAPVSAHLMAKAALHLRLKSRAQTPDQHLLGGGSCAGESVKGLTRDTHLPIDSPDRLKLQQRPNDIGQNKSTD